MHSTGVILFLIFIIVNLTVKSVQCILDKIYVKVEKAFSDHFLIVAVFLLIFLFMPQNYKLGQNRP